MNNKISQSICPKDDEIIIKKEIKAKKNRKKGVFVKAVKRKKKPKFFS